MLAFSKDYDLRRLDDRLRDAPEVTANLMHEFLAEAGRHLPFARPAMTARIERLIGAEAWTDATLALLDLELPQWQVRRIEYDEGEWHCALSRQRDLPDWLDSAIEAHHPDLPLAILGALVDARLAPAVPSRASLPMVPREATPLYEPVLADNFA